MKRLSLRRYKPSRKQVVVGVLALAAAALALNWIYQVFRKPTELFFPVSGALFKTPAETWRDYETIFRRHATSVMTPELLAALAQVEASGNPVARTPWRVAASTDPREIYRPASSAVGMYQITDATFNDARRYCIRANAATEDCWFNSLYMRVIPSHAVELTSAYLDLRVAATLARHRPSGATLEQKHNLAAIIHLCGASAGDAYAKRNFRLADGQRCGEHDPRSYLARVNAAKRLFARLSALG